MSARAVVLLAGLLLVGCTTADPNAWLLYAKASHTYGRMEAKIELLCSPPIRTTLVDFCAEATETRTRIRAVTPTIQAELTKNKPDWSQILRYVDLILSLAGAAL